ncbi:MAG: L,D-transpeptidase family protein, partial [Acidimicrobiales bacterium]
MNRARLAALGTTVAVVGVTGAAYALTSLPGRGAGPPVTTTTTTIAAPVTTDAPTTLAPPTAPPETTTTTEARPDPGGLARGAEGVEVAALQRRLAELRFDPGPVDGVFGTATTYAVWAFQKLQGMEPTGVVTPQVSAALAAPVLPRPQVPDGGAERVEIDLPRQLLSVYQGGELRLITHMSSGNGQRYCAGGVCGTARTPVGSFRFSWRYPGWRISRLGKLYNPVYFTASGIAVHGSPSVPTHPASHGCVRIPMHIGEYFPSLVARGDPVYVLDGTTPVGPAPPPAPDLAPPPADPPTEPDTGAVAPEPPASPPPPPSTAPTAPAPPTSAPPEPP